MSETRELLHQIIDNQNKILSSLKNIESELNSKHERLHSHIDFVENVYDAIRHPINYITGSNLAEKPKSIKFD